MMLPSDNDDARQSQPDYLGHLMAALRVLVLVRKEHDEFEVIYPAPAWLDQFVSADQLASGRIRPGAIFPFLDNFLADAESFWSRHSTEPLNSGPWVEQSPRRRELHLEARAITANDQPLLLIKELGSSYWERRDLLQKARENSLIHQRLVKEIQFKEVLLHCIVHDLAGPLMGIKGLFSLLRREPLSEAGKRRLDIGVGASEKMESLIQQILSVFSAEVESLETFSMDWEQAPDLQRCASTVVDTLRAAAELKDVQLRIEMEGDASAPLKVAGERTRLERVLSNLLENALRHSPSRSEIEIRIQPDSKSVRLSVSDQGSGVEAERAPMLFQRFVQGRQHSGKVGLGLYFCRIMVERWGGKIGYQPRSGGGSCFWFELPRIREPQTANLKQAD